MSAKERLQSAVKEVLTKEKLFSKEELSLVQERYKYLDAKLVDVTLNQAATEYFIDLQDGEDEKTVINSFIAGCLFEKWRMALAKTI